MVVLDRGRAVLDGAIGELTGARSQSVRVRVDDPAGAFAAALAAAGRRFEREGDGVLRVLSGEDGERATPIRSSPWRQAAGTPLAAVETVRSTLDQVFMQVLARSAS